MKIYFKLFLLFILGLIVSQTTVFAASSGHIDSVSPLTVYPGARITIIGSGFGSKQGSSEVCINSLCIYNINNYYQFWSDSQITVTLPSYFSTGGQLNINISNYPSNYIINGPNLSADGDSTAPLVVDNIIVPKVDNMYPNNNIVPGITKICITGSNFGTSLASWSGSSAHSSLSMGGIDITKASWTDSLICFTAPDALSATSYVALNVNGVDAVVPAIAFFTKKAQNSLATFNDPLIKKQYYLNNIDAISEWVTQPRGDGVTVAVIDTGIYINHPDLRKNIWVNQKEIIGNGKDDDNNGYIDDIYGWDFISNDGEMTTRGSHGTVVAGIIGAVRDNSIGIYGIADGVKLMPLIVCDDKIGCPTDAVIKAIKYAADNGANIINLSLASTGTTTYTDKYNDVIRYAYNKGVVIVAAAGNGDTQGQLGQSTDRVPVSPVCNDNGSNMVLGVSGTNELGGYLSWANYGSCVDVVAPALKILSTSVPDSSGSFYDTEDGTSFAAPMVAGLAALLKSKYPSMPNSEIISRIKRNAIDESDYNGVLGSGMIDISKTLQGAYSAPAYQVLACQDNATSISNQCVCNEGYIYSDGACVTYNKNCQNIHGKNSYGDKNNCYCNDGYVLSNKECVTYSQNCKNQYGSKSYGDKDYCHCSDGYEFNIDKTKCIKSETVNVIPVDSVNQVQNNNVQQIAQTPVGEEVNKGESSNNKRIGLAENISIGLGNIIKSIGGFFSRLFK